MSLDPKAPLYAVVPAAGVGKRMGAQVPKQYLTLGGRAILSHTLSALLAHPRVTHVVLALGPEDEYFPALPEAQEARVQTVVGGAERADSVLAALAAIDDPEAWALVHDAARPCLGLSDLDALLAHPGDQGAILAMPVRDTMKRADAEGRIDHTVERRQLWHALTPQLFPVAALRDALANGLARGLAITDEASAMEAIGWRPALVAGRPDNIKITHPEDLDLAARTLGLHEYES